MGKKRFEMGGEGIENPYFGMEQGGWMKGCLVVGKCYLQYLLPGGGTVDRLFVCVLKWKIKYLQHEQNASREG